MTVQPNNGPAPYPKFEDYCPPPGHAHTFGLGSSKDLAAYLAAGAPRFAKPAPGGSENNAYDRAGNATDRRFTVATTPPYGRGNEGGGRQSSSSSPVGAAATTATTAAAAAATAAAAAGASSFGELQELGASASPPARFLGPPPPHDAYVSPRGLPHGAGRGHHGHAGYGMPPCGFQRGGEAYSSRDGVFPAYSRAGRCPAGEPPSPPPSGGVIARGKRIDVDSGVSTPPPPFSMARPSAPTAMSQQQQQPRSATLTTAAASAMAAASPIEANPNLINCNNGSRYVPGQRSEENGWSGGRELPALNTEHAADN